MPKKFARYAVGEENSKGRAFASTPHPYRAGFERDRDRIIHCSAFRRLEGKTQVFSIGVDDHYRTRLTHTIEVAQIGRTISKALGLNEVLTEAICLGHDLGHSPFGHSGEKALNELMGDFGGFEHNSQSLRIVELLEHPYPDFMGLNLMYETRLGLAKHSTTYDSPRDSEFTENNCSLEGQVAEVADRIAYNCHDLEDALRSKLITEDSAANLTLVSQARKKITADKINDGFIRNTRSAKAIIDMLVSNCINASQKRIANIGISSVEDVYVLDENIICLSKSFDKGLAELEKFLMDGVYQSRYICQVSDKVNGWLSELFKRYCGDVELMPGFYQKFIKTQGLQRTVCDFIAGMTNRFCLKQLEIK